MKTVQMTLEEELLAAVRAVRKFNPDIFIRTHLMFAFPGETREDLRAQIALRDDFDRVQYFCYTDRAITRSSKLPDKIPRVEALYRAWSLTRNHPYHRE